MRHGLQFEWPPREPDTGTRALLEARVGMDRSGSRRQVIRPCHEGTMLLSIETPNPAHLQIEGTFSCACGAVLGSMRYQPDRQLLCYAGPDGRDASVTGW